jgi:hypothetical protein
MNEKRRLALTTNQHYGGDVNEEKEAEDRGKDKSLKVNGKGAHEIECQVTT